MIHRGSNEGFIHHVATIGLTVILIVRDIVGIVIGNTVDDIEGVSFIDDLRIVVESIDEELVAETLFGSSYVAVLILVITTNIIDVEITLVCLSNEIMISIVHELATRIEGASIEIGNVVAVSLVF